MFSIFSQSKEELSPVQSIDYFADFLDHDFVPEVGTHINSLKQGRVLLHCQCESLSKIPLDHPVHQSNCKVPKTRVCFQRIARWIPSLSLSTLSPRNLKDAFLHQVINGSYFTWDVWEPGHLRLGLPWEPENDATGRVSLNLIAAKVVTIQFEVTEVHEEEFSFYMGDCDVRFDRMFKLKRTRVDDTQSDKLIEVHMVIGFQEHEGDLLFLAQAYTLDVFPILNFFMKPLVERTFKEHVHTASYFNDYLRNTAKESSRE